MGSRTIEKTAGMYYLEGVKDTASGFKLNPDGSFQFFFTYGRIDRYGSGKWTLENDLVVLQSKPWSGKDFAIVSTAATGQNAIMAKMVGSNPLLLRHVFFSLKNGETGSWLQANNAGEAIFPLQEASSLSLVFEFCPERFTHFVINGQGNYFELRFEPWLMEVFFDNFQLKPGRYALTGKHPLLKGEKYDYEKT